jgi:hypothetical protein
MTPLAVFILVVSSFAILLTIHALECVVLARHSPRWGAIAFVIPPLAPVLAARRNHPGWATVWVLAALLYGLSLLIAKTS